MAFSAAWALAYLAPRPAGTLGLALFVQLLRWSALLGIGVAVAARRAHGRSAGRAFAECVVLALVLEEVSMLLWVGAMLLPQGALGPTLGGVGATLSAAEVLDMHLTRLLSAGFWGGAVGLAVGMHLGARRLGRRSAGLALVGPLALGQLVEVAQLALFDASWAAFFALAQGLSVVLGALLVPVCVALGDRALRAHGLADEGA